VDAKWTSRVIGWTPVSERLCVMRVRGKFFNTSIINAYAPHNDRPEKEKDAFYSLLEKTYKECLRHDVRIVIGDLNAQVEGKKPSSQQLEGTAFTKNPRRTD
jgi:exonuclease III